MRKLILLFLVACSINTYAKKDISEKVNRFGFNLGASANSVKIEGASETETKNLTKVGGFIGFSFEHKFGRTFALETGANFLNKGARLKFEPSAIINSGSITTNFYSIDVPLIAKFYIGKKKIFNLNVGGYASYAYLIETVTKADIKNNVLIPNDVNEKKKNNEDINGNKEYNAFDAGVNVGFEFVSRKGLGIGLKVNQGFVDATNNNFTPISPFVNDKKYALHTGAQLYFIAKF